MKKMNIKDEELNIKQKSLIKANGNRPKTQFFACMILIKQNVFFIDIVD